MKRIIFILLTTCPAFLFGALRPSGGISATKPGTSRPFFAKADKTAGESPSFNRPVPPPVDISNEDWLTKRRGIEALDADYVLPPFTALQTSGNEIEVWGRKYRLGDNGLVDSVDILDTRFLAGPMPFDLSVNGELVHLKYQPLKRISSARGRAEFLCLGESTLLDMEVRTSIEYDGMVKIDLTLKPKTPKLVIDRFAWSIDYPEQNALFLHFVGAREGGLSLNIPRMSNSFSLPAGEGAVWKSSYKPLVWLGNYEMGFLWFNESEQNWFPDERKARPDAISISRTGENVSLTVTPISQPLEISEDMNFSFGLFATPVRPLTPGWRGWTHNYEAFARRSDSLGLKTRIIYSTGRLAAEDDPRSVGFYPRLIDKESFKARVKKVHDAGQLFCLYLDPALLTLGVYKDLSLYTQSVWNPATDNLVDSNESLKNVFLWRPPESRFFEQWKKVPVAHAPYGQKRGERQFSPSMSSGYADFFCYLVEELALCGADGISDIDEWSPVLDMSNNQGYIGRDGKLYPKLDWFAKRDLMKRLCAIFLKVRGKPAIMIAHTAATKNVPITSFCDGILTGENFNAGYFCNASYFDANDTRKDSILACLSAGGEDWYHHVAPVDRWAVENGSQFGWAVMVMSNLTHGTRFKPEIRNSKTATRDFLAAAVVHDNILWPIFCNPEPAYVYQKIRQDFHIDDPEVKFYPYWGKQHPAKADAQEIHTVSYQNESRFLVNAANLSLQEKTVRITLDRKFFNAVPLVVNAESQEKIPVENDTFTITIPKRDYRIFLLE